MNFEQLIEIVIDYAIDYKCTIKDSINDLEFDGPEGSSGPSIEDTVRLLNHFGAKVDMKVNPDASGRGLCFYYSEEYIEKDDANTIERLLSL